MPPGQKGRRTATYPVPECMTFRPTYEELTSKGFAGYVEYMEEMGAGKAGIAKVVLPAEWVPRRSGYDDLEGIGATVIETPIKQYFKSVGGRGSYQTKGIVKQRMTVNEYRKLALSNQYRTPNHDSYSDLERKYWKTLSFCPPIYGCDVADSLTDKDQEVWNVAKLGTVLDMVAEEYDQTIKGVNSPYLYFGMWKATFSWHVEDMDLYAINYLHWGAPKTWYCVPPQYGHILEKAARELFPNVASWCSNFMRHKTCLIAPQVLDKMGVPYQKVVQEERNAIIVFPYAYHSGFNHGYNMAESTNFALKRWIEYGKRARQCDCSRSRVTFSMDIFVRRFQPERWEDWKSGADIAPHPEDPPEVAAEIMLRAENPGEYSKMMQERLRKSGGAGAHPGGSKGPVKFRDTCPTVQQNPSGAKAGRDQDEAVEHKTYKVYQHHEMAHLKVIVNPDTMKCQGGGKELLKEFLGQEEPNIRDLVDRGVLIHVADKAGANGAQRPPLPSLKGGDRNEGSHGNLFHSKTKIVDVYQHRRDRHVMAYVDPQTKVLSQDMQQMKEVWALLQDAGTTISELIDDGSFVFSNSRKVVWKTKDRSQGFKRPTTDQPSASRPPSPKKQKQMKGGAHRAQKVCQVAADYYQHLESKKFFLILPVSSRILGRISLDVLKSIKGRTMKELAEDGVVVKVASGKIMDLKSSKREPESEDKIPADEDEDQVDEIFKLGQNLMLSIPFNLQLPPLDKSPLFLPCVAFTFRPSSSEAASPSTFVLAVSLLELDGEAKGIVRRFLVNNSFEDVVAKLVVDHGKQPTLRLPQQALVRAGTFIVSSSGKAAATNVVVSKCTDHQHLQVFVEGDPERSKCSCDARIACNESSKVADVLKECGISSPVWRVSLNETTGTKLFEKQQQQLSGPDSTVSSDPAASRDDLLYAVYPNKISKAEPVGGFRTLVERGYGQADSTAATSDLGDVEDLFDGTLSQFSDRDEEEDDEDLEDEEIYTSDESSEGDWESSDDPDFDGHGSQDFLWNSSKKSKKRHSEKAAKKARLARGEKVVKPDKKWHRRIPGADRKRILPTDLCKETKELLAELQGRIMAPGAPSGNQSEDQKSQQQQQQQQFYNQDISGVAGNDGTGHSPLDSLSFKSDGQAASISADGLVAAPTSQSRSCEAVGNTFCFEEVVGKLGFNRMYVSEIFNILKGFQIVKKVKDENPRLSEAGGEELSYYTFGGWDPDQRNRSLASLYYKLKRSVNNEDTLMTSLKAGHSSGTHESRVMNVCERLLAIIFFSPNRQGKRYHMTYIEYLNFNMHELGWVKLATSILSGLGVIERVDDEFGGHVYQGPDFYSLEGQQLFKEHRSEIKQCQVSLEELNVDQALVNKTLHRDVDRVRSSNFQPSLYNRYADLLGKPKKTCSCGATKLLTNSRFSQVKVGFHKRSRCNKCEGCTTPKCNSCMFCLRPNLKQACIYRICLNPVAPKCPCFS